MIPASFRFDRWAISLAALLLAACGDEAVEHDASGDDRTAAGEVRGGTISDAMLPLDTVRSQNPPLRSPNDGNTLAAPDTASGSEPRPDTDSSQSSDVDTEDEPPASESPQPED